MLFRAPRLHEITKRVSVDNEEKRSKDSVLEFSNVKKVRSNQKRSVGT